MVRTAAVGLVAGLALAVVAGCGGSSPKPGPYTPSAAGSVSASSSGAPTMPAEAKGTTAESAEAFVRYFVDALNYAGTSGNVEPLTTTYSSGCTCSGIADYISNIYASGGHLQGNGWRIKSVSTKPASSGGGFEVVAVVDVAPQVVISSASASPRTFRGGDSLRKMFTLATSVGSWSITKIEQPDG